MDLILWRHADAIDGVPDIERTLSKKGKHQAETAAIWLLPKLRPEAKLWVSPSIRTRQTADALKRPYKIIDALYFKQDPAHIIDITGWPDAQEQIILVGHQPTLSLIITKLTRKNCNEVRKGSVWWLRTDHHAHAKIDDVYPPSLKPD